MGQRYDRLMHLGNTPLTLGAVLATARRLVERDGRQRILRWAGPPLLLLIATAAIHWTSTPDMPSAWVDFDTMAHEGWPLAGELAVMAACMGLAWAACNRLGAATAAVLLLWLPLAVANASKLSILGVPLLLGDLRRVGDLFSVFRGEFVVLGGPGKIVPLAAALGVFAAIILLLPRIRLRPAGRLMLGAAGAAFLVSLWFPTTNAFLRMPQRFRMHPNTSWTWRENAFIVTTALYCRQATALPPACSAPEVRRIVAGLPSPSAAGDANAPRPNLIVVLSESFWDPTQLPGVAFNGDPVPTFHQLQTAFGRLDLVSPTFGGITCNAEFEVLTGMSIGLFSEGSQACCDYILKPTPSLASILKAQGYRTVAMHAHRGIYNDDGVMPRLGFDQCISPMTTKADDDDVLLAGDVITLSQKLQEPYFICVNTWEAHVPYRSDKYPPGPLDPKFTKPLSTEVMNLLRTYCHAVHNADASLKVLIDHFSPNVTPTVIFFYGDHLPWLGENLLAYRQTGYCPQDGASSDLLMRHTQGVVWNNYGRCLPPGRGLRATSQMLPALLDLLGCPKPAHVRLTEKVGQRWPVISTAGYYDANGTPLPASAVENDSLFQDYRLMHGDLLFGDRHFMHEP